MSLTDKQKSFVEEYLRCWNATEAARRAGYQGNDNTLGSVGWENLQKPAIIKHIQRRLCESAMLADEVLARLAEIARGEHAKYITPGGDIDFARLVADDKAHLVKSIRDTAHGKSIDFCDPQKALVDIGRHHQLFTDNVDVKSGGKELFPADAIVAALLAIRKATDEPDTAT